MRRANTTFVNLRSTLDDVDPLVEASKPVAKRLQPFLSQARAFAADAEPTVRDLSVTIRRAGGANDLIDLLHSFPPLADIAHGDEAAQLRARRPRSRRGRDARRLPGDRRRAQGRRRARSASRVPTPPTSSAGSTTSRPRAAASTPSAPPRAASSRCRATSCTRTRSRPKQYRRCPGAAEAPAPDGSNVLSEEEREAARLRRGRQGGAEVRRVLVMHRRARRLRRARSCSPARRARSRGQDLQARVRQRLRPRRRAATSAWAA